MGLQGTLMGRWAWGPGASRPLALGSLLCVFVPDSDSPRFLPLCLSAILATFVSFSPFVSSPFSVSPLPHLSFPLSLLFPAAPSPPACVLSEQLLPNRLLMMIQ